jgi:hypothetical protein
VKPAWLALAAATLFQGCAIAKSVFVPTDEKYRPHAGAKPPVVLLEDNDWSLWPPFRTVGVLEVRRKEVDSLDTFAAEVKKEGTLLGCEILVQRDTYLMRVYALRNPMAMGGAGVWRHNGLAAWQFYCGVWNDNDEGEARYTRSLAAEAAVKLRDEGQGVVRCSDDADPGTHIHRNGCRQQQQ